LSDPEPEIEVPLSVRAGVWANEVRVFGDVEDVTLDLVRLGPDDLGKGIVVARVTLPRSCILMLKSELEGF
jgi:hypothetical protein